MRSDDEAAAQGRTVFLLRRVGIAILLPPASPIESVGGLTGKKLAVTIAPQLDRGLLKAFIEFYGLHETDLIELSPAQLGPAMKAKRVVTAIVFGPTGPGPIADVFSAVRKSFKETPSFLDIAEAEAITVRWPAYEFLQFKKGTFAGSPPAPVDEINTFAVTCAWLRARRFRTVSLASSRACCCPPKQSSQAKSLPSAKLAHPKRRKVRCYQSIEARSPT